MGAWHICCHMRHMDPCSVADSLQISTSPTTSEEDGSTDSNRGAQATTNPYRYAKMCDLTAMSVSRQTLHTFRQSTLSPGVTGSDTQSSRDRTRQALPTQAWRLCFGVVGRAAVSPRGAIKVQTAVGRASRWRSVRRGAPIDCGPSGVGGRRMGISEWRTSRLPGMGRRCSVSECRRCTHIIVVRGPVARRGPRASDG